MGRDKADLVVAGERLADRSARVLNAVCDPVLEVGLGDLDTPEDLAHHGLEDEQ